MSNTYIDINKVCNKYRLTTGGLANKIGVHSQAISRMKRTKTASLATLDKIATALDTTAWELIKLSIEEEKTK